MPDRVALVVIAKAPLPGRAKTRLSPPCTPEEAAELAAAALHDTLATVAATPARRRVLALDGAADGWAPPGFEIVSQRGAGLGERLAHALAAAGGPAIIVGMDTPQLTPALLATATRRLIEPTVDAVLGPADDGGYWAIGLRRPDPRVFAGVPMSTARTGLAQLLRLAALGLSTTLLPSLRDVDTMVDAAAVARACPESRFAAVYRHVSAAHAADHEQPMAEAAGGVWLELPHR
jgi:rSAM/selenodomain-associated transferase 1